MTRGFSGAPRHHPPAHAAAVLIALLGAAFLLATSASAEPACPNQALRTGRSADLPDCRAWEMVSPPEKDGGAVKGPGQSFGGGVLQASADGEAATFSSTASFGADAHGAPGASQYISRRTPAGWTTEDITLPTFSGAYGDRPDGVPYQLFSTDLARGLLLNGRRCGEAEPCPRSYSLRDSESGALTPLPEAAAGMRLLSASPDLRQIVFEGEGSLYEWSGAGLVSISLLPPTAGPGAAFQAASAEGRFAFYTEGGHLYRYDASAEAASDLTPAGGVVGVLGISVDGGSVYYQTSAGLFGWRAPSTTTEVAPGAGAAQPSDWPPATGTARVSTDGDHLAFLSSAELTGYDNTDQRTGQPDSEVYLYDASAGGGEGELICASCNPTGERPLGPSTIPGAIPNGEGPSATDSYKPRDLSTGGERLFFDSADALLTLDSNSSQDVYEWEGQGVGTCRQAGGCIGLISAGLSGEDSEFVDASADGSDAFFLTGDSLLPSDPGSFDLYDAREGGGFPLPPTPIPCDADACQSLPSAPEDPTPATLVTGPGNPPVHFPKVHHHKPHHKKGHKHRKSHRRTTYHKRGGHR